MTEATILWILGTLVGFLALLVGVIYFNIIKNQDKADGRMSEVWVEVNKIKERHHEIDITHRTLCQKHEDEMNDHREDITQHRHDITRQFLLYTEFKKEYVSRIHEIEISIRAIGQQLTK